MVTTFEGFNQEDNDNRLLDYFNKRIMELKSFAEEGMTEQELRLIYSTGVHSTIPTYNDNKINGKEYPIVMKFNNILFYLIFEKLKSEKWEYIRHTPWAFDEEENVYGLIWGVYTIDKFVDVRLYDYCKENNVGTKLLDFTFTFEELMNPIRFKATKKFDL